MYKRQSSRLIDIIASEVDKFWKIISRNTNFSENLIRLDVRLLTNYYKSLGFYDVKIKSNIAKINVIGNAELAYTIEEGKRYLINKISTNVDETFDKNMNKIGMNFMYFIFYWILKNNTNLLSIHRPTFFKANSSSLIIFSCRN